MKEAPRYIGVVGSVELNKHQHDTAYELIRMLLSSYEPPITVVSGGAVGIDGLAEQIAEELGLPTKIFLPKNQRWEPEGFKERNILVAESSDVLWRYGTRESKTYGSGWTADYAEGIGVIVRRVWL